MIRLLNNPLEHVIDIVRNYYPELECDIEFVEGLIDRHGAFGCTCFPEDGSKPIISIEVDLAIKHAVEVLAHELAHAATPDDLEHGEEWEKVFDNIHKKFCKEVSN